MFRIIGLAVLGTLCGCSGPEGERFSRPMPTWQRPELLYLQPRPHARLYVEIDRLEGIETKQGEKILKAFEEFLRQYCDKPEGITFVQEKPIPLSEAKGIHPHALALKHIDGPRGFDDARTAYLYVLVYDSKRMGLDSAIRPHVSLPYPAVYFDVAYQSMFHEHMGVRAARHEAGHLLGLCKNTDHGDGAHCTNRNCLMGPLILSVSRWFLRLAPPRQSLCKDCLADLAASKRYDSQERLRYFGALLVRQEDGYRVARLPLSTILSLKPIETSELLKARKRLQLTAAEYLKTHEWQSNLCFYLTERPKDLAGHRAALERATRDPDPGAAKLAKELSSKLPKQRAEESTSKRMEREGSGK